MAWVHLDRQMIVTIHRQVVTRIPRFSVSHDHQRTWLLHIRGAQPEDAGHYMCQVNSDPMVSQVGAVHVVGWYTMSNLRLAGNPFQRINYTSDRIPNPSLFPAFQIPTIVPSLSALILFSMVVQSFSMGLKIVYKLVKVQYSITLKKNIPCGYKILNPSSNM